MFFTVYWAFFSLNAFIVLLVILFDKTTPIDKDFVVGSAVIIVTSLAGSIALAYSIYTGR